MIFSRIELETLEEQVLAPYAITSRGSRGREFAEEEPLYRTAFQRDRDRILHTTAFRRLEYKTQVFINFESDYYRTRLTHTLEVAQIGRTVARALGVNEDLVEAICLVHDLGHPPFGHAGESALRKLMKDHGGFNHNNQSLRIVTQLEKRFDDFPGLNLTWEVREGIVKHESEFDAIEANEYFPELRAGLEAQIADAADELAYSAHDLDDGLRSEMIQPSMLEGITIWEILLEELNIKSFWLDDLIRHRVIRHLIGLLVNDLITTTHQNILDNQVKSKIDVQRLDHNLVSYSEDVHRRNRELKDFLYSNLYRHYKILRMNAKAEGIISGLYRFYVSESAMLPPHIQMQMEMYGLERTVCDYIAGMTDRYAIEEYSRLFDPTAIT